MAETNTSEETSAQAAEAVQAAQEEPQPHPSLRALDVLIGGWTLSGRELGSEGEVSGQVRFEWLEGGYYLVQHFDINHAGRELRGVEYIGYDAEAGNLHSYVFGNTGPGPFGGVALEYVYEVTDETLTIWGGFVGSPAAYRATFSDDHNTAAGAWEWPGGGYTSTMTRK